MEGDPHPIVCVRVFSVISIHSLRMEGDISKLLPPEVAQSISIHSLRMEGDKLGTVTVKKAKRFQSTPSAWRETVADSVDCHPSLIYFNPLPPHGGRPFSYFFAHSSETISIHSLRMEGDADSVDCHPSLIYFNPLPPHGGRPKTMVGKNCRQRYFNPLPPHGGRHFSKLSPNIFRGISIHSLRMEGDIVRNPYQ